MADGSAKLSGRNNEFQEPTLRRVHRKERESLRRISWIGNEKKRILGSHRSSERISFIVIILNREVQLHVLRNESCPIPLNVFDVTRSTYADLEVAREKRIYDCWDVDENRNLSESWTGFHKIYGIE